MAVTVKHTSYMLISENAGTKFGSNVTLTTSYSKKIYSVLQNGK